MSKTKHLCNDPECPPDCVFCARIRETGDREALLREKMAIDDAILTANQNEDRESAAYLSKKKKIIGRKLYQ